MSFHATSGFGYSETLRDFLNARISSICTTSFVSEPCASFCAGKRSKRWGSAARSLSDVPSGASVSASLQNAENWVSVGSPSANSEALQSASSICMSFSCTTWAKASAAVRLMCFGRGFCDLTWIESLDRVLDDGWARLRNNDSMSCLLTVFKNSASSIPVGWFEMDDPRTM